MVTKGVDQETGGVDRADQRRRIRLEAADRAGGNGQGRPMMSILIEGSGKKPATDQDGGSEQGGADPTVTDQRQRSG